MSKEILKSVPMFADLDETDLVRLTGMLTRVGLDVREVLFCEGDRGESCYVIESGDIEIFKAAGGREVLLAVRGPGDVIGEMALFEDAPRIASARARTKATLLSIEKAELEHLLATSLTAARAMFYTTLGRLRQTETMLRQSEKMAQVGTLTAGVAHELNNPAAAVRRGTDQLLSAVESYAQAMGALDGEPPADLTELVRERARRPVALDPLDRSDREAEVEAWLDAQGIEGAWDLAPQLVSLGVDPAAIGARWTGEDLANVLRWVAASAQVYGLLEEIGQGAGRISDIVKSLKTYSYLDQAPSQEIELHEGIESTLVMLRGKLKGIEVVRRYDAALPKIHAWGSELNQVWTNLLDNAADALGGKGTITIRTRAEGADWVVVEVEDNGPGIPREIQDRVFDAFFTTKPPGKGTGLGLEISWRIVVDRHRGEMKLQSRPGSTVFQVWLPRSPARAAVAPATTSRVPEAEVREILESVKSIAVVGIRDNPDVPAHTVPAYLKDAGYHVIPVNPGLREVLGEKSWPDLKSVPEPVDLVLVFRRPEAVPPIVNDAIAIGAKIVWMQEGIRNDDAARDGEAHGLRVVMDTCIRSAHRRMMREKQ